MFVEQTACFRFVYAIFEYKNGCVFPRTEFIALNFAFVNGCRDVIFEIRVQFGGAEMLEHLYSFGIMLRNGFPKRTVRFFSDALFMLRQVRRTRWQTHIVFPVSYNDTISVGKISKNNRFQEKFR